MLVGNSLDENMRRLGVCDLDRGKIGNKQYHELNAARRMELPSII